jgi:uncharacterized membrane protein (UPF0127 family)
VPRYRVTNLTRNTLLAERAEAAQTFLARLRGLVGRGTPGVAEGLWLAPCTAIHTWFMREPIDALFLGAGGQVLHVEAGLRPWRRSGRHPGARGVLELPSGRVAASGTRAGDRLALVPDARAAKPSFTAAGVLA